MSGSDESEKECRDCRQRLPLADFPPSKKNADGRTSYCRSCTRARARGYRDAERGGPPTRVADRTPAAERTTKWCPDCGSKRPLAEFGRNRASRDGLTAYCRPCHNARGVASKERMGGSRSYHLKRRYGVTATQVDALIAGQGGVCALCRVRAPEHVDHDHVSGRVRGVLCSCCNQGLGNFRDDAVLARRAGDYLERTTWSRHEESTGVYRLRSPRPAAPPSASSSQLQHLISTRRAGSCPPA